MREEEWRDVKGYEGIYQISTTGQVRNRTRIMRTFAKQNKKNRRYVTLTDADGTKRQYPVAKLMARTFLNQPDGTAIYHKNGILSDDWIGNISFLPQSEIGKINGGRSRRRAVAKIDRLGEIVKIYPSVPQAAKDNYLSEQCVRDRCNGWQNRHGKIVKLKSLFAPDEYAYAWAEPKDIERTVRKCRSTLN